MMEGPLVVRGRVVGFREGPEGRVGRVREGDTILVHAGVALALVRDEEIGGEGNGEG